MEPDRAPQPSGLHVAVAVISAVMVLSGFSYATSRIVAVVSRPDVASQQSDASDQPAMVSTSADRSRPQTAGYHENVGVDRRWFMPVEVVLTASPTTDRLRATAPQGRPLVVHMLNGQGAEAMVIEAIEPPMVTIDEAGNACLPPLQRGAYPFVIVPVELDGMLSVE